jgi:hypothetical protein
LIPRRFGLVSAQKRQVDGTTVKRTIASTAPSATYTSAQQTLDFGSPQVAVSVRVRQVGSNGRGGSARSAIV